MSCGPLNNESADCMTDDQSLEKIRSDDNLIRQSDEEAAEKMTEKCSVCLGVITDPTRLENCDHNFCYNCIRRWLLHCEVNSCPLCKKPITSLIKMSSTQGPQKITMNELEDELACERRATRCNAVPLVSERIILNRRIHDLRVFNSRLENTMMNEREYREKVSELTALRLLTQSIDDRSISRSELISNTRFRFATYCCDSFAYVVDSNDNPARRNFTVKLCRENMDGNRARVVPFILNELAVIVSLLKRELKCIVRSVEGRFSLANNIFEICGIHQIMSPPFKITLIQMGFPPFIGERFQHELFEFASSGLECEEYWKIVGYRLRGAPISTSQHPAIDGAPVPNIPVVVLDDAQENAEDEDDVLIIEDSRHANAPPRGLIPFSPHLEVEDVYGHRWDADPTSFVNALGRLRRGYPRAANLNRTTVVLSSDEESDENSLQDSRMDTSEEWGLENRSAQSDGDVLNVTNSTESSGRKKKKSTHGLQRTTLRRIERSIRDKDLERMEEWSEFLHKATKKLDGYLSKYKDRRDHGDRHRDSSRDRYRSGYRGPSYHSRRRT